MRRWGLAIALLAAGCQIAPPPLSFTLAMVPEASAPPVVVASSAPPVAASSPRPEMPHGGHHAGGGGSGGSAPSTGSVGLTLDAGFSALKLAAGFQAVSGLALGEDGTVYAADAGRHEVVAVATDGSRRVVAGLGDGQGGFFGDNVAADATPLNAPMGLAVDATTGAVFVADSGNGRVRLFTPGGRIYTYAGGGTSTAATVTRATSARVDTPWGVACDRQGHVVFTERGTGRVRRVEPDGKLVTLATVAAGQGGPLAGSWDGASWWVGEGSDVRLVRPGETPALIAEPVWSAEDTVLALAYDQAGTLYVLSAGRLWRLPLAADGRLVAGRAAEPVAGEAGATPEATVGAVSDAAALRLGADGWCQLAIDLAAVADPEVAAGAMLLGNSFSGSGELLKLTPR